MLERQRWWSESHNQPLAAVVPVALLSIAMPMSAGAAEEEPPSGNQSALAEVLVSATRSGEQSLQTVPMAISVISPEKLDSQGLGGVSDFVGMQPSVNMQTLSPGENSIEMRGLTTHGVDPTNSQQRSLVAVYLDDTAITQEAFTPDLHVYDLERIEVIKGPQGTLYGAGSMAGTIRMITKKPDASAWHADADASVSFTQFGGTNNDLRGMLNVPISDQLAARLTVYRGTDSGYIQNIGINAQRQNSAFTTQGRLAVEWKPTDTLTFDASATLARLNAHGRNAVYPQLGDYTFDTLTAEPLSDNFRLYNLSADWNVDFAHLILSSSYIQRDIHQWESFERIDEAYLTPGIRLPAPNDNGNHIHDFQQEVRLVSRTDQKLRWITGAYFQHDSRYYPQRMTSPGFDAAFGSLNGIPDFNSQLYFGTPQPDVPGDGDINIVERQYAIFGEVTYAITSKLDLTVGARYFDFTDDFKLEFNGVVGSIAPGEPITAAGEQHSSGANPRVVVRYELSDSLMLYAEAARGFRYGGVNEPAPPQLCSDALAAIGLKQSPVSFGPDSLWSYTLGEKAKLLNDQLLLNVDGFYIDWRNVQTIHDLPCGYYFAEDKGKIASRGLELEASFKPMQALTLSLNGSYTNAYANGPLSNLSAQSGERVPYFPKAIINASAEYRIPVGHGDWLLSADYTYRSDAFTEFSPDDPLYRQIPASRALNASVGFRLANWSVQLYGTNLTADHQVSTVQPNFYGNFQPGDIQFWGRPRTIGLHLHFGL